MEDAKVFEEEEEEDGCYFLAMVCTSKGWTVMEKPLWVLV
jgi:hypothetical protein